MIEDPSNNFNLELLDAVDAVTEADIEEFRANLGPPVLLAAFDEKPEDEKIIVTALYKKGFEVLARMIDLDGHFVGIHDIRNHLNFLFQAVPEFNAKWGEKKRKDSK